TGIPDALSPRNERNLTTTSTRDANTDQQNKGSAHFLRVRPREHHRDLFSAFLSRYVNQDKLSLQDALNKYPGLEPVLLEAWQRHLTRKQVGKSESRQSDSPLEWVSNKSLTSSQIAITSEKLDGDVA
ncbi:MAG: hypothetical protein ACRDEA_17445, partial [Microcystaceae cyanobacterium]